MRIEDGNATCVFTHIREKSEARQEKQASEQRARQARHAFRQAGKVASWSVGSRALVVSAAAKGRNRGGGMGEGEGERGRRRSGYHRKMEP